MRMALLEGSGCDLNKLAFLLQLFDRVGSCEAHTAADTAAHLEDDVFDFTLISYAAFNALGNKLFRVLLEISVLAAALHCSDGSHASVNLIFAALVELSSSGALLAACEHGAHHADISACSESLSHIAGEFDSAVGDDRDAVFLSYGVCIHDCGDLRNADSGDYTGRADRTGADTDFDRVSARHDQVARAFSCRDIAADHGKIGIRFLYHAKAAQYILGVAVGGVKDNDVDFGLSEGFHALKNVSSDAYACAAKKTALVILGGVGILDILFDVLDRDETDKIVVVINDGKLLLTGLGQDLFYQHSLQRLLQVCRSNAVEMYADGSAMSFQLDRTAVATRLLLKNMASACGHMVKQKYHPAGPFAEFGSAAKGAESAFTDFEKYPVVASGKPYAEFSYRQERVNTYYRSNDGLVKVSVLSIQRKQFNSKNEVMKSPWSVNISNFEAAPNEQKNGTTSYRSNTKRNEVNLFIQISDDDMRRCCYAVSHFITAWEMAYGIPLIQSGVAAYEYQQNSYRQSQKQASAGQQGYQPPNNTGASSW